MQPLKNRTASLIVLSLTGNLLLYLFGTSSHVLILLDRNIDKDSLAHSYVCDYAILSSTLFHPMFSIPYFLRCWRLYAVFIQKDFRLRGGEKKRHTYVYWARERNLFLFGVVLVGALACLSILGCVVLSMKKYMPQTPSPHYGCLDLDIAKLQVNNTICLMIVWYSLENILLLIFMYKLRHVQDDFNISHELKIVFVTWVIASFFIIVCVLSQHPDMLLCLPFIAMIRNYVCLWFSSLQPLI